MWTSKQANAEGPDFLMSGGTTKSIRRHKESYSKHTYLGLLWLRKASHDTDWHLWWNGKPVSYASRVWNDYEKNYAPIEKEMRAVVFGLHKFSDYCYGRHVTIESDHKPLEAICNKPLSEVPKRLLRMVLSMQKFNYKITYKKGSDIIIADALSRAPV